MKKLLLILIFSLIALDAQATTWYVRTDGGTNTECDGTHDAAQAGATDSGDAGSVPDCSLNHPNWVFPPRNESSTTEAANGDTVVIASGSYRMGCQNSTNCRDADVNLTQSAYCNESAPYDCIMSDGSTSEAAVPSNITVVGCTASGCASSDDYPELWGAGRMTQIFKLSGTSGVTLKHLILTDHASCLYSHDTLACGSSDSSELSAKWGVVWSGASDATLTGVKIRGMYAEGIKGVCIDCVIDGDSEINFNYTGYDTTGEAWTSTQSITFGTEANNSPTNRWQIAWNGCADDGTGLLPANEGCISNGGSDGYGGTATDGIVNVNYGWVHHNAADGLDFLYFDDGDVTMTIKNTLFSANGGNQLKFSGNASVYNNIFESWCGYFHSGNAYVNDGQFEYCRSGSDTIAMTFQANTDVVFDGNTINFNDGNDAFTINARNHTSTNCTSANSLTIRNLVAKANGKATTLGGGTVGWMNVDSNCTSAVVTVTNSNIYNYSTNPSGTGNVFTDPLFSGVVTDGIYDAYLSSSSPGRDIATESTSQPSTDYNDFDRGAAYDAGALEYGSTPSEGGGGSSGSSGISFGGARWTLGGGRITKQ